MQRPSSGRLASVRSLLDENGRLEGKLDPAFGNQRPRLRRNGGDVVESDLVSEKGKHEHGEDEEVDEEEGEEDSAALFVPRPRSPRALFFFFFFFSVFAGEKKTSHVTVIK